jgi:hypothetical protein
MRRVLQQLVLILMLTSAFVSAHAMLGEDQGEGCSGYPCWDNADCGVSRPSCFCNRPSGDSGWCVIDNDN